ncbi:Gfo/Idh/MocA family oxidoreductase [Nonomuraea sp. NPDC050783]|uniref:Gfo/Idh/MocA family protein n=1 Tax=Nonomuraea sp. NPDC050783 TaxID=3154634 RepID=UPI003467ED0C
MVTLALVGAGARGAAYARHAAASGRGRVVAVADPLAGRRARFPGAAPYAGWREPAALRYTPYTRVLKALLDSGRVGEIVSIQHLEPVGWWHQAHSYVRGNWRRTDEATFMLLAKSCHDLDWLVHLTGRRVTRVSSFGGLKHFRPENRPAGAAERCLDCAAEPGCPYSAKRLHLPLAGRDAWPVSVLTDDVSEEGVLAALRTHGSIDGDGEIVTLEGTPRP